jgi:predicted nucleotidyltransferase
MSEEGVLLNAADEERAEFLINDGIPIEVVPVTCVLSGSRAYNLNTDDSDHDYLGLHFMDTWECLEHPDFRRSMQVIRKRFHYVNGEIAQVPEGVKGSDISLDTFEMWKFVTLLLKGSFVTYEMMYLPTVLHRGEGANGLINLCRQGMTSKIGRVARGNVLHDWSKKKFDRKKTIMAYYRLLQAIYFLREEEFEWDADRLWDYTKPSGLIFTGHQILESYRDERRKDVLSEKEIEAVSREMEQLIDEVDKSMIITRLPDYFPKPLLEKILQKIKQTRSQMI